MVREKTRGLSGTAEVERKFRAILSEKLADFGLRLTPMFSDNFATAFPKNSRIWAAVNADILRKFHAILPSFRANLVDEHNPSCQKTTRIWLTRQSLTKKHPLVRVKPRGLSGTARVERKFHANLS
ncbi:MAG: hypothetical protein ACI4JT_07600 [Oscillospiraceae bacterium]